MRNFERNGNDAVQSDCRWRALIFGLIVAQRYGFEIVDCRVPANDSVMAPGGFRPLGATLVASRGRRSWASPETGVVGPVGPLLKAWRWCSHAEWDGLITGKV